MREDPTSVSWMDDPREQYEWPKKPRKMTEAETAKQFAGAMIVTFLAIWLYTDWVRAAVATLVSFGAFWAVVTLCSGVWYWYKEATASPPRVSPPDDE